MKDFHIFIQVTLVLFIGFVMCVNLNKYFSSNETNTTMEPKCNKYEEMIQLDTCDIVTWDKIDNHHWRIQCEKY